MYLLQVNSLFALLQRTTSQLNDNKFGINHIKQKANQLEQQKVDPLTDLVTTT